MLQVAFWTRILPKRYCTRYKLDSLSIAWSLSLALLSCSSSVGDSDTKDKTLSRYNTARWVWNFSFYTTKHREKEMAHIKLNIHCIAKEKYHWDHCQSKETVKLKFTKVKIQGCEHSAGPIYDYYDYFYFGINVAFHVNATMVTLHLVSLEN